MTAAKRVIDIVVAATGLAISAAIVLPTAIALRWSTRAPALIRQERAGIDGRAFMLLKLRTMTNTRDTDGRLLPDDDRLTRLGRVVRTLSIDELPQLLNVLRGEMSIVGPRPLPVIYDRLYTPRERNRLRVRPGLTGWAQINGRQRISFSQRLELDAWYVEHRSLLLDLKIMLLTIPRLLGGTDVMAGQDVRAVDDRGFGELFREYQAADDRRQRPA